MVIWGSRAVEGGGLRPLACWEYGFDYRRGHGCLSIVCCQADHSSRGVLPNVLCLSVILKPQ